MDKTISLQAAIDALKEHRALYCDNTPNIFSKLSYAEKSRVDELDTAIATLVNLPSAQHEIIRCKDCRKHNISPKKDPENCCPLYHYRGMSFGGEHDLQFCSYAKRREE